MSASTVYSNHAGTMSDSFAIGKRGVKLLQGISEPTGVTAPVGSLYLLRSSDINRVYQINSDGVWTALLSPDDLVGTGDVSISVTNGIVTISTPVSKYQRQFTSEDLSSGLLSLSHNLNEDFPIIQIYNGSRQVIQPDSIATTDANSAVIGLNSFGSIAGTWTITVISN